jgi:hypothetical protein
MSRIGRFAVALGVAAVSLPLLVSTVAAEDKPGRKPAPDAIVSIDAIDPDALVVVARLLAVRGYYLGPIDGRRNHELELSLRSFARAERIERPMRTDSVCARTIDELGAGPDVAVRWGSDAPRAPELSREECYRVNYALATRGYRGDGHTPDAIDAQTVDALRRFQSDTGHPVQLGNCIRRRWLFILGVATPESCPPMGSGLQPIAVPRVDASERAE